MKRDRSKMKTNLLMVTDYQYPCNHAVMENVFSKEVAKEVNVNWIMQGANTKKEYIKWNESKVYTVKMFTIKNKIAKFCNRVLWINIIFKTLVLVKKNNVKIVLIRDLPLVFVLLNIFKTINRYKVYYQYSAPQGDIFISRYMMNKGFLRIPELLKGKIHNYLNRYALKRAEIIFPISQYHKKKIAELNINKKKIIPLTMGVDLKWIQNEPYEVLNLKNKKKDNYWITYIGSMGLLRRPDFMLRIIKELIITDLKYRLIMVGGTPYPSDLIMIKNRTRSMKLDDYILYTGKVGKKKLQEYIWYSDVCISPIPPTEYYKISSPTKLYEYMGHGKPVVANKEILEQKNVIEKSMGGMAVGYNVEEFVDAIKLLIENENLRKTMGMRARNYIMKNYTYAKLAKDIMPYLK